MTAIEVGTTLDFFLGLYALRMELWKSFQSWYWKVLSKIAGLAQKVSKLWAQTVM